MFRNIYIEAYKNSIANNSNIDLMVCHLNHIYSALGCVIQDIQYMIANLIACKKEGKEKMNAQNHDDDDFVVPKIQLLPSSSFKFDYPQYIEKPRNFPVKNNKKHSSEVLSRPDSFEEMFPKPTKEPQIRPALISESKNRDSLKKQRNDPPPQSQEDFMDLLFKKK